MEFNMSAESRFFLKELNKTKVAKARRNRMEVLRHKRMQRLKIANKENDNRISLHILPTLSPFITPLSTISRNSISIPSSSTPNATQLTSSIIRPTEVEPIKYQNSIQHLANLLGVNLSKKFDSSIRGSSVIHEANVSSASVPKSTDLFSESSDCSIKGIITFNPHIVIS